MLMDTTKLGHAMPVSWDERVRTLWIGNLPRWADKMYLCLCFYHFNAAPRILPGNNVKIIRNPKTGCSYGFMTFETHKAAERTLLLYNGLKIMPGTTNRFCLNWAFYSWARQYKSPRYIGSSKYRSDTPLQLANDKKQISEPSNLNLSIIADLPLDVIENILLRLPAKSIVRCRMTCKAWASLTSETRFIYTHLENQTSLIDPIVVAESAIEQSSTCFSSNYGIEADCTFRLINFRFPYGCYTTFTHNTIPNRCQDLYTIPNAFNNLDTMSNTCNGLTCVYKLRSDNDIAIVVNPSIRETIQLPRSSSFGEERTRIVSSIGMGYNDCSDTYKIVRMFEEQKTHMFSCTGANCEVITLGGATCYWSPLGHIPYHIITSSYPIFLHGAIYWTMSTTNPLLSTDVVISFNVRTETIRVIPVPEVNQHNRLFVLEERLWLFTSKGTDINCSVSLYILEDYMNCKWAKKHTIEYNFIDILSIPVANHRDGKIFFAIFPTISSWIARLDIVHQFYYDMKTASFKKKVNEIRLSPRFRVPYNCIHGCAESLVSPISYLQRSNNPCTVFLIFGQKWATLFPFPSQSYPLSS